MKILIYGVGGIGGFVGSYLKKTNNEINKIDLDSFSQALDKTIGPSITERNSPAKNTLSTPLRPLLGTDMGSNDLKSRLNLYKTELKIENNSHLSNRKMRDQDDSQIDNKMNDSFFDTKNFVEQ